MISLATAENALKNVYLGVLANQLNCNICPLLSKIEQTSRDVWGKEIIALTTINGKQYQLRSELANIYGKIEITDKAIRCSQNSAGAFVNLLNDEMENLLKETSRQITNAFYNEDKPHDYMSEDEKKAYIPLVLNGLKYLFDDSEPLLYGVDRKEIAPITKTIDKFDNLKIQELIDNYNEDVDFIICSPKTKREYQEYLSENHRNIEIIAMEGGYKSIAFNGIIPIVTNRNVKDNEIYLISTKDFKLHRLCDWEWLSNENDNILRQHPSK
ncbi:MAG: phage major capsid protein, partial [Clostridia bacterium]|nr:phage major capsid protein [Clostridia bacterium]